MIKPSGVVCFGPEFQPSLPATEELGAEFWLAVTQIDSNKSEFQGQGCTVVHAVVDFNLQLQRHQYQPGHIILRSRQYWQKSMYALAICSDKLSPAQMPCPIQGLVFRAQGLGFRVQGLGSKF